MGQRSRPRARGRRGGEARLGLFRVDGRPHPPLLAAAPRALRGRERARPGQRAPPPPRDRLRCPRPPELPPRARSGPLAHPGREPRVLLPPAGLPRARLAGRGGHLAANGREDRAAPQRGLVAPVDRGAPAPLRPRATGEPAAQATRPRSPRDASRLLQDLRLRATGAPPGLSRGLVGVRDPPARQGCARGSGPGARPRRDAGPPPADPPAGRPLDGRRGAGRGAPAVARPGGPASARPGHPRGPRDRRRRRRRVLRPPHPRLRLAGRLQSAAPAVRPYQSPVVVLLRARPTSGSAAPPSSGTRFGPRSAWSSGRSSTRRPGATTRATS
jgi:hypothetical protein